MRILLVSPPSYRFGGISNPTFHLGLGYLASVLRNNKHTVAIYDANMARAFKPSVSTDDLFTNYEIALNDDEHEAWKEAEDIIKTFNPDMVGISFKIVDIKAGYKIAQIAKRLNPKLTVVAGGPAATTCSSMIMKESTIDYLIHGEGESTLSELTNALLEGYRSFEKIKGLSWRNKNSVITNESRELISNLDDLPFPARDALIFADRLSKSWAKTVMGNIITSRGCPYGCTFCANHAVWGSRKVRYRSAQNVVDEVLQVKDKYGVKKFIFWDDHLTTLRQRVIDLCNQLIDRKADIEWISFARANTLDKNLLDLMKRAGCIEIQLGVESGCDRVLKMINKNVSCDQNRKGISLLREAGIRSHVFLMVGFPSETKEEMRETMSFYRELKPDSALISVVTPYPGTELFNHAQNNGLKDIDWLSVDTFKNKSVLVDTMAPDQFSKLFTEFVDECNRYNYRRFIRYRFKVFIKHGKNILQNIIQKIKSKFYD